MSSDTRFYIDMLKGEQCLCERRKRRGYWFCFSCYRSLPGDMQRALWRKIGSGGRRAYDEAVKYLEP